MVDFIESNYSLDELNKFRDKNGFIDLSQTDVVITDSTREKKGTTFRLKNWVDFKGKKVLLRGDAVDNYSAYAELIVEEIAKELGVDTAHYDLIKIKGNDEKYITGVLSESMIDFEHEELFSLHDLIGDEPESDDIDYLTATRYTFTIDKLREYLTKSPKCYSKEFIEKIIEDYKKRLMFSLVVMDTDKHPENISFISDNTGDIPLRLSPNYDSEFSLMLEDEKSIVQYYAENPDALEYEADIADPKIGIIKSKSNGGLDSMWKDTLEMLIEDDELYNYYNECIRGKIDMDEIIKKVESRIGAKLPEEVKVVAKNAFNFRNETIEKIMDGELEQEESEISAESFLMALLGKGIQSSIRTGEQAETGKRMEELMGNKEKENSLISENAPNLDDD